jgi:hypothetical protein
LTIAGIAVGTVGTAVGAGAAVAATDGAAVAAGKGVAVADEPQAKIAANNRAKGPRIIILGFFNQCFKIN